MKHYTTLDTSKYVSLNARSRQKHSLMEVVTNLLIVVLAVAAGYYAIKTMPAWLPTAENTFHEWTNYRYM